MGTHSEQKLPSIPSGVARWFWRNEWRRLSDASLWRSSASPSSSAAGVKSAAVSAAWRKGDQQWACRRAHRFPFLRHRILRRRTNNPLETHTHPEFFLARPARPSGARTRTTLRSDERARGGAADEILAGRAARPTADPPPAAHRSTLQSSPLSCFSTRVFRCVDK